MAPNALLENDAIRARLMNILDVCFMYLINIVWVVAKVTKKKDWFSDCT